jgi:N-acetylglucosaminyl-diphospho-decaprenol L-rhamnosyltransferase
VISVVTVLHGSGPHVARLLDSLERHLPGEAQVIAVDTGPDDGGAVLARERGAEILPLPGNPGFGPANNAGLARARHDVTALLNPDVELLDAGLLDLAGRARAHDALLVPRLLNPDGSVQDSAHPLPGTRREVLRALLPARLAPQPYRATRPRRVGWAIAAALVARTSTLRALGPFDADAFLFYEDLDLCLRSPVPVELHPDVALRHAGGHSTGPGRLADEARRRREVVGANLGRPALRRDDLAQALTFARGAPVRARSRAQLRALRHARRAAGYADPHGR